VGVLHCSAYFSANAQLTYTCSHFTRIRHRLRRRTTRGNLYEPLVRATGRTGERKGEAALCVFFRPAMRFFLQVLGKITPADGHCECDAVPCEGLEMVALRPLLEGRGLSSVGRHESTLMGRLRTDDTRHDVKKRKGKNHSRGKGSDAAVVQRRQRRRGIGSVSIQG